jgi:hypothetical protein
VIPGYVHPVGVMRPDDARAYGRTGRAMFAVILRVEAPV